MHIHPMSKADVSAIMPIEIDSFPDPWSPLAFLADLEHNPRAVYRVLRSGGQVCGYVGLWKVPFGIDIVKLCVSPDSRGAGFGTALLSDALTELGDGNSARVLVRSRNSTALSFYDRFGFEKQGVYEGYYSAPSDDAVVMTFAAADAG